MNRYEINEQIKTKGKRRLATLFYPALEETDSDTWIIAKRTDRLDLLATKYYEDPRCWVVLAKENNVHGTLRVPAGKQIRIPYLQNPNSYISAISTFNN